MGLEKRKPKAKKRRPASHFTTKGVNWFLSLDGHDKLMGFQNSTFPISIYGIIDQATRKILLLKCWTSNSDPYLVAKWYIEWLKDNRILASNIRLDRGTETVKLSSIHGFLRATIGDLEDSVDSVVYGPSTSNQIERWWRELHDRLEKRIKSELNYLLRNDLYNPHEKRDRDILAFIVIPLVQRELRVFKDTVWNSHRIRYQKRCNLPNGIPNHIYVFPFNYGLDQCGFPISIKHIEDAAVHSGIDNADAEYLDFDMRQICEKIVRQPEDIPCDKIITAYRHIKDNL